MSSNALAHTRPSATTRVSIRWGDGKPEELTSTLVLTSPAKLFVDLRIFIDPSEPEFGSECGLIEWAFAGCATHGEEEQDGSCKCAWMHWVDSRTSDPMAVHDAGTATRLPNGDTLERGEMCDADGVLMQYEEIWHDEAVTPERAAAFVCFCDMQGTTMPDAAYNLGAEIDPGRVCGMVVRVGGWCQGIVRELDADAGADVVTAERWRLAADGTWTRVFRTGTGELPCALVCAASDSGSSTPDSLSFVLRDRLWRCVELFEGGIKAAA